MDWTFPLPPVRRVAHMSGRGGATAGLQELADRRRGSRSFSSEAYRLDGRSTFVLLRNNVMVVRKGLGQILGKTARPPKRLKGIIIFADGAAAYIGDGLFLRWPDL